METERKGGRPPGPDKATQVAIQLRRKQVLDLRVKGYSIRAIAEQLGFSPSVIHNDIQTALERTREETDQAAEQERQIALEQIAKGIVGLMPDVEAGDPKAVAAFAKLDERRAKYLGLDAPSKHEHSGPDGEPIPVDARSELIERISGMVARATASGGAAADPGKPGSEGS